MKLVTFCGLSLLLSTALNAQRTSSFLTVEKDFFHEEYTLNGYQISEKEVLRATATFPEVVAMLKASRRNELLGRILVGIGGGSLIGVIADGIIDKELMVGPSLFSAMIFASGVVVWNKSIRKAEKSVELYNYQQSTAQNHDREMFLNFGLSKQGLSLAFRF